MNIVFIFFGLVILYYIVIYTVVFIKERKFDYKYILETLYGIVLWFFIVVGFIKFCVPTKEQEEERMRREAEKYRNMSPAEREEYDRITDMEDYYDGMEEYDVR